MKPATKFEVRELVLGDIPLINRYWAETTQSDLIRMGELTRPDEKVVTAFMEHLCETRPSPREAEEGIMVWLVDERPIGYSTLKKIEFGQRAEIHLHLWEKSLRGKGYGAILFCLTAAAFRKNFELEEIVCEPKADNPMPNRMLEKIGFPRVGTTERVRSDGSRVTLNRYRIDAAIGERFLAMDPSTP